MIIYNLAGYPNICNIPQFGSNDFGYPNFTNRRVCTKTVPDAMDLNFRLTSCY